MTVRIGVVVFPGSNRDIDAVNALEVAGAEPVDPVARGRRRSTASPAILAAGRLRLRRLPPGRRDRPVQPGHARGRRRSPRTGGLGPRDLQRLPGPHRGPSPARRAAPQPRPALRVARGRDRRRAARHAVHPRASASGGRCGCRSPTARACFYADEATLDELEARRPGPVPLRRRRRRAGRRRGGPGEPERLAPGDRRA